MPRTRLSVPITGRSLALTVLAVLLVVVVAPETGWTADGAAQPPAPAGGPPKQDVTRLKSMAIAAAQTNNLFVPITPCRIVDTRKGGGPLASGATRAFAVSGSSGFTAQGGNATGCGVPASATAVAIGLVATAAAGAGYLTAWPVGAGKPVASVLNYLKGTTSTGSTVAIKPAANPALNVFASKGAVQVVIDVNGYYLPQMHGLVSPPSGGSTNAPIYSGSSRIVSATSPSDGVYQVVFDGDITYCTPMVDTYNAGTGIYGAAYAFNSNTATVYTWYLSSTTHLETPFGFYFYIDVVC